jgi:hypothetical protein
MMRRLEQDHDFAARQREVLQAEGLTQAEVERGMEPLRSFRSQLAEEVEWYERVRQREFR